MESRRYFNTPFPVVMPLPILAGVATILVGYHIPKRGVSQRWR
ncbi:MAG: hypothetical protein ACO2PK_05455 [Armatimonadota bacterium]